MLRRSNYYPLLRTGEEDFPQRFSKLQKRCFREALLRCRPGLPRPTADNLPSQIRPVPAPELPRPAAKAGRSLRERGARTRKPVARAPGQPATQGTVRSLVRALPEALSQARGWGWAVWFRRRSGFRDLADPPARTCRPGEPLPETSLRAVSRSGRFRGVLSRSFARRLFRRSSPCAATPIVAPGLPRRRRRMRRQPG